MEGKMYRVVGEDIVEFVLHGNEILAVTDPKVKQLVGQLVLWEVQNEDSSIQPISG
jgi:hypothetical protein